jgi:hypothetical protein
MRLVLQDQRIAKPGIQRQAVPAMHRFDQLFLHP